MAAFGVGSHRMRGGGTAKVEFEMTFPYGFIAPLRGQFYSGGLWHPMAWSHDGRAANKSGHESPLDLIPPVRYLWRAIGEYCCSGWNVSRAELKRELDGFGGIDGFLRVEVDSQGHRDYTKPLKWYTPAEAERED